MGIFAHTVDTCACNFNYFCAKITPHLCKFDSSIKLYDFNAFNVLQFHKQTEEKSRVYVVNSIKLTVSFPQGIFACSVTFLVSYLWPRL